MKFELRPYQVDIKGQILSAWASGTKNVLAVLPTGAGKTVSFADIISEHVGPSIAIAHRQELVSQISLALARDSIRHRIVGPQKVIKLCVNLHMLELGRSYFDPAAKCGVAGVDTLIRRTGELGRWLKSVTLWVQDEAHHVLKDNKWGTAVDLFPDANGLGVTATPDRADGKGLATWNDGVFEDMVVGPSMRDLINLGYLTDYRIFAPPPYLVMDDADISSVTGDYKHTAVVKKFKKSKNKIIGDVVQHYLKHARGKLGITFVPDVEDAHDTAKAFNDAGVPAEAVSAKTPDAERISVIRRFKNGELQQLVNVDLFGEGFDLPAIEVVSMARPTQSYALYVQQFGRALRLMDGKVHALIIDHVGNVLRHGLPDAPQSWTLEGRERRSVRNTDSIPMHSCTRCTAAFERLYTTCPMCGYKSEPASRADPDHVDGDLFELDADTLARMRNEIAEVDRDVSEYTQELIAKNVPTIGRIANAKRFLKRQEAIKALRASIGWWGAYQRDQDRDDSESYKRFYFKFGIDVGTAQTLKTKPALELATKINLHLGRLANE